MRINGFTLIELLITISIAGILTAFAIPTFSDMIRNERLTAITNDLISSVNLARFTAISRGETITIKAKNENWREGWTVERLNCVNNCVLKDYQALRAGYTLRGNIGNSLSFQSNGSSENAGNMILCANDEVQPYHVKLMKINYIGRMSVATDTNQNGIPELDGVDITICNFI